MLRICGKIEIDGSKASIDRCALIELIPDGIIRQMGLKRKVPETDSWTYQSRLYDFHLETLDSEIRDFLNAHSKFNNAMLYQDAGIEYAFFTLCPVDENSEETFACIFSCETLQMLANMGLELQIAPGVTIPDAPYWKS